MKIITRRYVWFYEDDYKLHIKPQLKEKHIKIKDVYGYAKISRQAFYDMMSGKIHVNAMVLFYLCDKGVLLPFNKKEIWDTMVA